MGEKIGVKPLFMAYSRPPPQDIFSVVMRALLAAPIPSWIKKRIERVYYQRGGDWKKELTAKNTITAIGFATIGNRLTGASTYASTSFPYFAWSNGVTAPTAADTAASFYADGTQWGTKAVTTIDAFDTVNYKQTWECYLSTTDNSVTSITKFALMDALAGAVMFNSVQFAPLAKSATIERYFLYTLTMSQI